DLVDWVELIPFDETRNYVQRVLEARNMYRLRLADGEVARLRFLQVAGPIRPAPTPFLTPQDAARDALYAEPRAGAPRPRLKPVETSLSPSTAADPAAVPAPPPEARRAAGPAEVAHAPRPDAIQPSGQTDLALTRIPQARPA